MTDSFLARLFEHNHWANLQILEACLVLSDEMLDATPQSATKGTIRQTLVHLVTSQRGYLALLTVPVEARPHGPVAFGELLESARLSGEGLIRLTKEVDTYPSQTLLRTKDGFSVEPWVVAVQVINHATEHREQIKSMLSTLGVTPPEIDGWNYGVATRALLPVSPET